MIIERTNSEVIFRLPANIDVDALQDITDLFQYQEITGKSKAAQRDVDVLVKCIKNGRWERTKRFSSSKMSMKKFIPYQRTSKCNA